MVKFAPLKRADRQLAWVIFALALALYLRTLAPGLLDGDAAEFQTAAWRWGLAHATGYPLYLLTGGVWQHLLALVGVSPATALNAWSALSGAGAVALLYYTMLRLLPGAMLARRLGALFATLLFAVNPTFWSQNLIAEVYSLQSLLLVAVILCFSVAQQRQRGMGLLALLCGLALAHHAMTLLLLPPLVVALLLIRPAGWRSWRTLAGMAVAGALPLLLYLYVPLRSGAAASPWYHQRIGNTVLDLYENTWAGLVDFITGRSISVGFHGFDQLGERIAQAGQLWLIHFTWVGLLLVVFGLVVLWRQRNWPLLVLTLGYAVLQQTFNLFYAIGDILVYYIPLYLVGAIWCGYAIHALAGGLLTIRPTVTTDARQTAQTTPSPAALGVFIGAACFLVPLGLLRDYYPRLDQSNAHGARRMWDEILAAQPPADAILVSNDRNEIAPLFYVQYVEGQATGMAGLFPLIQPGPDFVDIGATVTSALRMSAGRPVLLTKSMPGLAIKFALKPQRSPLVRVEGYVGDQPPAYPVNASLGPLELVGYDWVSQDDVPTRTVAMALHWLVHEPLNLDYTTTVQIFAADGTRLAQDDEPPGGLFYPTTLWKPGEVLVERRLFTLPQAATPAKLLVGMYSGPALTQLAPPIEIAVTGDGAPAE